MSQQEGPTDGAFAYNYVTKQCPEDLKALSVDTENKVGGQPTLDLNKLAEFMRGSELPVDKIKEIRRRGAMAKDVCDAFKAYYLQLKRRKVSYDYNDAQSPFMENFKNQSNCQGLATGFLQLMVVLGIKHDRLKRVHADGKDQSKIVQKQSPDGTTIFRVTDTKHGARESAPNAIKLTLSKENKFQVYRTSREPFANHYAAKVKIDGATYNCWDPLVGCGYKQGLADYFDSYEIDKQLELEGIVCYTNREHPKRRLYHLPAAFSASAIVNDPQYKACLADLTKRDSSPRLFVIIDDSDWTKEARLHPPVILELIASRHRRRY